jgi:hypothetical protein
MYDRLTGQWSLLPWWLQLLFTQRYRDDLTLFPKQPVFLARENMSADYMYIISTSQTMILTEWSCRPQDIQHLH